MGCYKYPREFNWVTGVVLLFLTLAMGFTGQLLRWDQNAVWSVVVGSGAGRADAGSRHDDGAFSSLAGKTIGGATLSRFFAFHVFFIPAIIFAFVGIHLFLVMHDGISEPPVAESRSIPRPIMQRYDELIEKRWRSVLARCGVARRGVLRRGGDRDRRSRRDFRSAQTWSSARPEPARARPRARLVFAVVLRAARADPAQDDHAGDPARAAGRRYRPVRSFRLSRIPASAIRATGRGRWPR